MGIFKHNFFKRIIGLSITVFFIIVTIIILIIAQGKKISNKGEVIETSIIRINAIPKDVEAFINNKSVSITDSQIINLDPGEINLKLTKNGYTPWEKQVLLKSGIVTDIYAQLYPESIKFQALTNINIDRIYYSQDSAYAYYSVINSTNLIQNGLWRIKLNRSVLDFNENKPSLITSLNSELLSILRNSNYKIKISIDNNKILLSVPDKNILQVFDSNQNGSKIDIVEKLGFLPSKVEWFRDSSSVILIKSNVLFELDLNTLEMSIINLNDSENINFTIDSNICIYFKNNKLYKYFNKISTPIQLSSYIQNTIGKILNIEGFQMNQNIIVLKTITGIYYVDFNKNYVDLINIKGSLITLAQTGRSLIFLKDSQYYSYNLEETLDGRSFTSTIYNLNLKESLIKDIYFSPSSRTIITLQNKDLTLKNSFVIMDFDGDNKQTLLSDFNIMDDKTLISQDSIEIYALIEDKQSTGLVFHDIYKFSLEVK